MVDLTSSKRFDLWSQFLQRWPIATLATLTLEEYNSLGSKDSFCYWLESRTESLGSIWGGSSFKFGIFEFDPEAENANKDSVGILKDGRYKWLKKYGTNADEAFEKIKTIIISIAKAASDGTFSAIDSIDLGHATKWKIAFLYQPKGSVKLPCVYRVDWLRAYTACYDSKISTSQLYSMIWEKKSPEKDIFAFSDEIWQKVKHNFQNAWLIAAGEGAYLWDDFVKSNMIKIGWSDVGDLSPISAKKQLETAVQKAYPNYSEGSADAKSPDKVVAMLWSFSHEIKVGDVVFVKSGMSQIIGRGTVKSDYKFGEYGEYQHARDVEWTHTGKWEVPFTCPQRALSKLSPDKCRQLEEIVSHEDTASIADSVQKKSEVEKMNIKKVKIPYALNTIFYGPPGTGKTYTLLNLIANKYFYEKVGQLTEAERNAKIVSDLAWWEIAALCLLDLGKSAKVPQILVHPLMVAHLKNTSVQHPNNAVWGQLQIHTKEDCPDVKFAVERRADPKVFFKDKDSTWTVDRDLLTEVRPDLLEYLEQYYTQPSVTEIKRYQFITFHQSYSYENFVEGICAETDEDGNIRYDVKPGVFWKFCQQALNDPEHNYALFIDEINRGNVSGIFGELIALIENDKREELHVTLPYSKKDFCIPKNLYIFGSMNTADRSIDALDSALRRRFSFVEMVPKPELLLKPDFTPKYLHVDLCALLKALNRRVEFLLDRDHKIGHSYFMHIQAENADEERANLKAAFKEKIIPLLEDYFYGNLEKVRMVLGDRFIVPEETNGELTSDCLMRCEDPAEFQDKTSLKVADISALTEEDFSSLIK